MASLFKANRVVKLLNASVEKWHNAPITHDQRNGFLKGTLLVHSHNFELWHEEDHARDPDAKPEVIAQVKRSIDGFNQQRNDAFQQLDELVKKWLDRKKIVPAEDAPQNSETVGSIVDRLSILALKIFHMREESMRGNADQEHRKRCAARLAVLIEQQMDLAQSLEELQTALEAGKKRFKVYYQMKMYNDPSLNPVLYAPGKKKSR